MRIAPIISLVLSIVVGIAAVILGRGWLSNEAEATDSKPAVVIEKVDTQKILVADIIIARGDLLTETAFRTVDWPVEHVPEGAIEDIRAIIGETGGFPYALGLIAPGEPLLTAKLSERAVRDTLPALIEPGFRAMSVEVNDVTGVAGFILPDHKVDVNVFKSRLNPITDEQEPYAQTLLQNIRVLAVDQKFQENLEGAAPARTVTLQVTPSQARRLGLASETTDIGLVLRPKKDEPLSEVRKPRPVQRPAINRVPVKPVQKFTDIRIIQGDQEESVSAPVARSDDTNGGKDQ